MANEYTLQNISNSGNVSIHDSAIAVLYFYSVID